LQLTASDAVDRFIAMGRHIELHLFYAVAFAIAVYALDTGRSTGVILISGLA